MNRWKAKADAKATLARETAGIEVENRRSKLDIKREKQQHQRQMRDQRHRDKIQRANRARTDRQRRDNHRSQREKLRRQRAQELKTRLRDNVAGTVSGGVYIIALAFATIGQMQNASRLGMPWISGAGFAAILEGGALACAFTAHKARMAGERSVMAQTGMVGLTTVAITMQIAGHANLILGGFMAAATVVAVFVFEMRLSLSVTEADRKRGIKPPARFGPKRWIVAPFETFAAWRVDVLSRATGQARIALSALADRRAEKRTARGQARTDRGRRRAASAYNRAVRTALTKGVPLPDHPDTIIGHQLSASAHDDEHAPGIAGQPAWIVPDTVPDEWVEDAGYAARTPSADTPDSEPDTPGHPDADSTADEADNHVHGTDSHNPVADSTADNTNNHRTPNPDSGQDADTHTGHCVPAEVVSAYRDYLSTHGRTPSARKLAGIAGIGKTSASKHLKALKNTTKENTL